MDRKILQSLECPFNWNLEQWDSKRCLFFKLLANLNDRKAMYNFQHFVFYILCVYLATAKRSIEEGWNVLIMYEYVYGHLISDDRMKNYRVAFKHIIWSSLAFVLSYLKKEEELNAVLKKIPPLDGLNRKNRAAILAVRAALMHEFGPNALSVELTREALMLDPEQGEWWHLHGKGLQRYRKYACRYDIPTDEELRCAEKAVQMNPKCPLYMVLLARSYAETVVHIFYEYPRIPSQLKDVYYKMNMAVLHLLNSAKELGKDSWHVLYRCGFVYLKLPKPYKNRLEAIRCLEGAHEIRPREATINHHLGTAYGLAGMFQEAISYLERALQDNIYGALLDYIRYTLKLNNNFDVVKYLDDNYNRFTNDEKADLLCQKGSYLIIVERNIIEGLNCYLQAMKVTDNVYLLEKHLPVIALHFVEFGKTRKFSIYELSFHLVHRMKNYSTLVWVNEQELCSIINGLYPGGFNKSYQPPITYIFNIIGLT